MGAGESLTYDMTAELDKAYRRHPMSEEPEGGEVAALEPCVDEDGEAGLAAMRMWRVDSGWRDEVTKEPQPWERIVQHYLSGTTWCYLPPRGDHG